MYDYNCTSKNRSNTRDAMMYSYFVLKRVHRAPYERYYTLHCTDTNYDLVLRVSHTASAYSTQRSLYCVLVACPSII